MVSQVIGVSGWKCRKRSGVTYYRCPGCKSSVDMIFWGPDGLVECFRCNREFPHGDFRQVRRTKTIAECASCGREVPLIPSTFGMAGLGFICSGCSNYVAVLYGNRFVNPRSVLEVEWNPTIIRRGERVFSGERRFVVCRTAKDFLILKVLQAVVKEEDSRFLFARPNEHSAGVLLDSKRRKYLGFLVWTEGEYAVLRQIFIVEEDRRRGHAENMVRFWVERYADPLHAKFGIESPNEQATRLHLKLGHLKIEGDSYVGVKCFRVPGM
jgi:hypothetical protein